MELHSWPRLDAHLASSVHISLEFLPLPLFLFPSFLFPLILNSIFFLCLGGFGGNLEKTLGTSVWLTPRAWPRGLGAGGSEPPQALLPPFFSHGKSHFFPIFWGIPNIFSLPRPRSWALHIPRVPGHTRGSGGPSSLFLRIPRFPNSFLFWPP